MADDDVLELRIDQLNPEASPSLLHQFPAMKDGVTVFLTVGQVIDLIGLSKIGEVINAATALTSANLADGDKITVYDVSANALVTITVSQFLAGLFKTGRTIANAQFAAASFKLFNAAGTPRALTFDTTGLAADRKITMPDRDVNLGAYQQIFSLAYQAANTQTALIWTGINPSATEIVLDIEQLSATGTDLLLVQLGTAGGLLTSGYDAGGYFGQASPGASSSVAGFLVGGVAAARAISGKLILTKGTGNHWIASLGGGRASGTAEGLSGGGSVDLAGAVTQVCVTRSGSNTFDQGGVSGSYKV